MTEPVNNVATESRPLTVLYDGACPLCRREIGLYRGLRPLQSNSPVCFADVSDAALPLPPGTTREQLLARFHVRGRDGELLSGAQAFLALWADFAALGISSGPAQHGSNEFTWQRTPLISPLSPSEQAPSSRFSIRRLTPAQLLQELSKP